MKIYLVSGGSTHKLGVETSLPSCRKPREPNVVEVQTAFEQEFHKFHDKFQKKFKVNKELFKEFQYVPQLGDKLFHELGVPQQRERAREWMHFWIPAYTALFGASFEEMLKTWLVDTTSGQQEFLEVYRTFVKRRTDVEEGKNKPRLLDELKPIIDNPTPEENMNLWAKILKNKDEARISNRQLVKLASGGVTIGGLTGDRLARLAGMWSQFSESEGIEVALSDDGLSGYVKVDRLIQGWIEQVLDHIEKNPKDKNLFKFEDNTFWLRSVWDKRNISQCPLGAFLIPAHLFFQSQLWSNAFLVEARKSGEALADLQDLVYYLKLVQKMNDKENPYKITVCIFLASKNRIYEEKKSSLTAGERFLRGWRGSVTYRCLG